MEAIDNFQIIEAQDENAEPSSVNRRLSNLMLLTHSRKADMVERKATQGAVKPEMDPFWEARNKSKTNRLMHNAVTEGIRSRAVSRLHENTTTFSASTRLKAYDEKVEDHRGTGKVPKVREESNVSALKVASASGPTPLII
jgi:predicted glutamine amidotransferase